MQLIQSEENLEKSKGKLNRARFSEFSYKLWTK